MPKTRSEATRRVLRGRLLGSGVAPGNVHPSGRSAFHLTVGDPFAISASPHRSSFMALPIFTRCAIATLLCALASGSLLAQEKSNATDMWSASAPDGTIEPLYRVTGARASPTLATVIHCSNNDSVPVSVYVTYFDFNDAFRCAVEFQDMPVGTTRSFTTANATTFAEDRICATPAPTLSQGRVEIGTFPYNSKVICSAQVVSINGDPPTTLSSLDIFRAN
jgi:hypothetical protein